MPKKTPKIVKEVWNSSIQEDRAKNKHISYSQLSIFATCQKQWADRYIKGLAPYTPSIHTVFGSAFHETMQSWLEVLYHGKVKDADEMDVDSLLYENMIKEYQSSKKQNGGEHLSTLEELQMFWLDGKHIFEFLKKKRRAYFTTKGVYLAGIETLLYQELRPGVMFKGFIDLVFYDERVDEWTIVDIKTSTKGWNKWAKADDKKKAQLLLYKEFFSKQFNIPLDKIKVEYFIVKRRIPKDAEFAAMQKRVQEFRPTDGPRKMKEAVGLMENFVSQAVGVDGNYLEKEYPTNPSKNACRFCPIKELRLCPDAIF
tara:strand:- start:17668 stop:18606 length:939 start_codon:yes stop_codon:yes gene_type:complete